MKRKRLSLFFATLLTGVVISVTSFAFGQPPRNRDGNPERRGGPPRFELGEVFPPPLLDELELTADQEKELDAIKQDLKARLEKLLTDDQKQRVEDFRPRGPRGPGGPDGGGPDGNGPPPRDPPRGARRNERPGRPPADDQPAKANDKTADVKLKELPKGVARVPVTFSGGHDTDSRDGGRPVVLIAAALGVSSDVFRDAFSKVLPGPGSGSEPEPAQVRQNKAVLMEALGKHGITNDELDKVSNYYRYVPGRNSLWTNQAAVANALVKDGSVIGYEIVSGGFGYSSTPTVSVPNIKGAIAKLELAYGKEMEKNGSVSAINVSQTKSN